MTRELIRSELVCFYIVRIAKENVRGKILDAAERRLLHYGFKKTTIDEIAADAGVGKGTVYLYFDSKEEITLTILCGYKASVLHKQGDIAADATLSTVDKLKRCVRSSIGNGA